MVWRPQESCKKATLVETKALNRAPGGTFSSAVCIQLRTRGNFSWLFMVDDDFYLSVRHVHNVLSGFDASKLISVGIPGCGMHFCNKQGGYCGGGGFAMTWAALESLMQPNMSEFQRDLMANIAREKNGQSWADISVSCTLRRHGVSLLPIKGLYGWRIDGKRQKGLLNEGYLNAIRAREPLPLTFHYINADEMRAIHQEFQALKNSSNQGRRMSQSDCQSLEYDAELSRFLAKENARRRSLDEP